MSKTPSRCTSYSRLFSIVDYFSTLPRMPTQADRASIDSIGSLLAWMLNPLINMILMHPGEGVSNYYQATNIAEFWRRWHITLGPSCATTCIYRWAAAGWVHGGRPAT